MFIEICAMMWFYLTTISTHSVEYLGMYGRHHGEENSIAGAAKCRGKPTVEDSDFIYQWWYLVSDGLDHQLRASRA